jgi:hypothetical protein
MMISNTYLQAGRLYPLTSVVEVEVGRRSFTAVNLGIGFSERARVGKSTLGFLHFGFLGAGSGSF